MSLEFQYGQYSYQYFVEFLERKSLTLVVRPDLRIIVKAPVGTGLTEIEDFLTKKWLWLEKQLTELKKYRKYRREPRFVTGESHWYLGRQYLLDIRSAVSDSVKLERNKIVIFSTKKYDNSDHNRLLFEAWLEGRCRQVFKRQFIEAYKMFNLNALPQLKIRRMNKRWGSCSRDGRVIYLNPELIKTSTEMIRYVCIHEFCHVGNPSHNRKFYDLLERKMPDWRRVKNSLEVNFG